MSLPEVVSPEEWLAARKELLAKEKELTRTRDALSAERRRLPMVKVEKEYVFEGPDGPATLAGPVRRPPAAHRRPLHVRPELGGRLRELLGGGRRDVRGAPGARPHPGHHASSTYLARRSRRSNGTRPRRAGRSPGTRRTAATSTTTSTSPWTSRSRRSNTTSGPPRSTLRRGRRATSRATSRSKRPGRSSFLRDGDTIFHTYSVYARGLETMGGSYYLLDETALGRQEEWEEPKGRAVDARGAMPDFSA